MLPIDDFAAARRMLRVDAATCAGAGALLTVAAATLAELSHLPAPLLTPAGAAIAILTALEARGAAAPLRPAHG